MAGQLRACGTVIEDPRSVSSPMPNVPQLPVTTAPGDLTPSFELLGHLAYMCTCACIDRHTYAWFKINA